MRWLFISQFVTNTHALFDSNVPWRLYIFGIWPKYRKSWNNQQKMSVFKWKWDDFSLKNDFCLCVGHRVGLAHDTRLYRLLINVDTDQNKGGMRSRMFFLAFPCIFWFDVLSYLPYIIESSLLLIWSALECSHGETQDPTRFLLSQPRYWCLEWTLQFWLKTTKRWLNTGLIKPG